MPDIGAAEPDMNKVIAFVSATRPDSGNQLGEWLLIHAVRELAPPGGAAARLAVNTVDMIPAWLGDLSNAALRESPPYDAMIEVWSHGDCADIGRTFDSMAESAGLAGHPFGARLYRVTELVEKDTLAARVARVPGIRLISAIEGHEHLSDREVREGWDHHVAPALRVHRAMTRYVRNWVEEILTPGARPIHGIAVLNFASDEDLKERFFDSEAGKSEIRKDTGSFVRRAENIYAREYLVHLRDG
jgi:hypothetical protein